MAKFQVYAEATGTFVITVEATSAEEAWRKADEGIDTSWELVDEPEVGSVTAVECKGKSWEPSGEDRPYALKECK